MSIHSSPFGKFHTSHEWPGVGRVNRGCTRCAPRLMAGGRPPISSPRASKADNASGLQLRWANLATATTQDSDFEEDYAPSERDGTALVAHGHCTS